MKVCPIVPRTREWDSGTHRRLQPVTKVILQSESPEAFSIVLTPKLAFFCILSGVKGAKVDPRRGRRSPERSDRVGLELKHLL